MRHMNSHYNPFRTANLRIAVRSSHPGISESDAILERPSKCVSTPWTSKFLESDEKCALGEASLRSTDVLRPVIWSVECAEDEQAEQLWCLRPRTRPLEFVEIKRALLDFWISAPSLTIRR